MTRIALGVLLRRDGFVALALCLALLFVLGGLGTIRWLRLQDLDRAVLRATERVGLQADAASHLLESTITSMEALFNLARNRDQLSRGNLPNAAPFLALLDGRMQEAVAQQRVGVFQIAIIDALGIASWSTQAGFAPVDLSDRAHFRAHIEADIGLYVSEPVMGRVSGRWSIQFSRRITGPDGSFRGVAVLSVDPFWLARDLSRLGVAPEVDVILYRNDGRLLTRARNTEAALDRNFIAAVLPPPGGSHDHRWVTRLNGDERFVAMRSVPGTPLLASITAPAAWELAPHARFTQLLAGARVVVVSLAGAGVALALLWRSRQRVGLKASAAELTAAERERVLNAMRSAVYIVVIQPDLSLRVIYGNAAFDRFGGAVAAHTELGMPVEPPLSQEERASFFDTLETEGELSFERRYRATDGTLRWARWQASVIARHGAALEVLVTTTDIQVEKAAVAAISINSRMATLGEVSAALAHELNQPLTVIGLSAELSQMLLQPLPEAAAATAGARQQVIIDMVARAKVITDHLRLFSRQAEAEPNTPVALAKVMDGVAVMVSGALEEAGVRLELALPADLPPVSGSQVLLEQVMLNLLLNARDALAAVPAETRAVRVSAEAQGAQVLLRVEDTGPGIAEAALPRLFEPFFTTKAEGEGTGLGLSICFGILRAAGGKIGAANRPEGGACFTLTLRTATPGSTPP